MKFVNRFSAVLVSLLACTHAYAQQSGSDVLAIVNGEPVYAETVDIISGYIDQEGELTSDEILDELISLRLLSQAAQEIQLDKDSSVAMAVELQIDQALANAYTAYITERIKLPDDVLRSLYDLQISLSEKTEFRASHLQFNSEAEASAMLVRLANGEDFDAIINALSVSTDGITGGDLGWSSYGADAFERSVDVEKLAVNELSMPIETSHGWHIFKVTDTRGAVVPSFESIKDDLRAILLKEKLQEHLSVLRETAFIEMSSN